MKRLIQQNINTPEEYSRIFHIREQKNADEFDLRRWNTLLKEYKGGKLIDLGSLDSQVAFMAKAKFHNAEIWGMDQSPDVILEMQKKYPQIHWYEGNIYRTGWGEGYFNYVVMGEVLEHLEYPEKALQEAMRILHTNGTLAISVPYNEAIEPGAVDGERHLWSFIEDDFMQMLKKHGSLKFKILRSIREPVYKYCFPQLIIWCKKYAI